jgi:uncharacterized protein YndB with AHSA1/START domain
MSDKTASPATRSITLEVEIDAPRDAAWHALTTPEGLARWFPPISGGAGAAPGDKLLISWGEAMEWWTTVVAVDPQRHVQWIDDPAAYAQSVSGESDKPALAMDWFIETRGGKTVVRLVNSGFAASSDWDEMYDATTAGWQYFLFNLRHYLENHRGTPRVQISERRKSPVGRNELWNRLIGSDGFAIDNGSGDALVAGETRSASIGSHTVAVRIEHANRPSHLWLRFPTLGDAIFFAEVESGREGFHCGLWLSTYGLPDPQVTELRDGLRSIADRVFAPAS